MVVNSCFAFESRSSLPLGVITDDLDVHEAGYVESFCPELSHAGIKLSGVGVTQCMMAYAKILSVYHFGAPHGRYFNLHH